MPQSAVLCYKRAYFRKFIEPGSINLGKVAVSAVQGAVEGAVLASGASAAPIAAAVFATEAVGGVVKKALEPGNMRIVDYLNVSIDSTINTVVTMGTFKLSELAKKFAATITQKLGQYASEKALPYVEKFARELISHGEIGDTLELLSKNGIEGIAESDVEFVARYIVGETAIDAVTNRTNSVLDCAVDL